MTEPRCTKTANFVGQAPMPCWKKPDHEGDCEWAYLDPSTPRFVKATDFMKALHEAGLLPQYPWCSRVVIDAQAGDLVQMFVDQIPGEALLSIAPLMSGKAEGLPLPATVSGQPRCPVVRLDWASPPHGPQCVLAQGHTAEHVWEMEQHP